MYVVIVKRVVKVNTGSTEKFAPRSANRQEYHVSGPYRSFHRAEAAVSLALGTHTCLSASVWSADQVATQQAKYLGDEMSKLFSEAARALAAYVPKPRPPLTCASCKTPIESGTYCRVCDENVPL